jgi:two-component system cell cycle response regulator DivK
MKTILIVEDNDKNMKLARDVLQAKGYRRWRRSTASDGVRQALAHKPDLVLMDIQLPDINGIEAFSRIRANADTASIPIVAFTASVMSDGPQPHHRRRLRRVHRQADQPQGVPGDDRGVIGRTRRVRFAPNCPQGAKAPRAVSVKVLR